MKSLLTALVFAFAGAAAAAEPPAALYSFADVYRLTVGSPMAGAPAAEAPVRIAAAQARPAEPRFLVALAPQRDKWLLVLAGLALAGWVAHRRLGHPL